MVRFENWTDEAKDGDRAAASYKHSQNISVMMNVMKIESRDSLP